jgi:threonylcarbamoyladenosine tRNA methylthiotransferase MtaB
LPTEIISLGCRLNLAEGEAMTRLAREAGLGDAIVINSCAVTGEAVRQTRQEIRRARRDNPSARVVVTGCAAQIDAPAFASMPEVDAVIGNAEKLSPASWSALAATDRGERTIAVNDIMAVRETAAHLIDGYGDRARAFLQVQNGCDHRCTFCIIPFGRGPSRSVTIVEAIAAVRRLVDAGHAEIVLTGIDMTSWGGDLDGAPRLGRLVAAILDGVPELFRLRLSSVDCAEIDDELFERLTGDARTAPYLHLSLQSGDNLILKRMKRRHSREDAIRLAERLRARRPGFALGADFIAGFPTETVEMFEASIRLIDEAGVNFTHVFPYSPRDGTPAARMPRLHGAVIAERARRLRAAGGRATERFLDGLIGAEDEVIVESGGRARLGNFAPMKLKDGGVAGGVVRARVIRREAETLIGARIA